MLKNLFGPLEQAASGLRHVTLLQGTKAYGVHVRPLSVPARENRSEMHEQPNFYWNQERFLRETQKGKAWTWSILRPVLIVGDSVGSAMNVIPALGVYAAMMRRDGKTRLDYPGGVGRVAQQSIEGRRRFDVNGHSMCLRQLREIGKLPIGPQKEQPLQRARPGAQGFAHGMQPINQFRRTIASTGWCHRAYPR